MVKIALVLAYLSLLCLVLALLAALLSAYKREWIEAAREVARGLVALALLGLLFAALLALVGLLAQSVAELLP